MANGGMSDRWRVKEEVVVYIVAIWKCEGVADFVATVRLFDKRNL